MGINSKRNHIALNNGRTGTEQIDSDTTGAHGNFSSAGNGLGGGHASELEDGGNRIEGGYTFRAEESAHGIERRLGMEFGSGAHGKCRAIPGAIPGAVITDSWCEDACKGGRVKTYPCVPKQKTW